MTETDFLAAMRDAPDDDDLRLVYADWLEENGEPLHAEYVRASIESSRIKDEHDERRSALFDRVQELERLHGYQWQQRLAGYLPEPLRCWFGSGLHFARGVPGWLDAEASRYAPDAEAIHAVFPITSVSLRVSQPSEVDLLGSLSGLRHCRWLSLFGTPELGNAIVQAVVGSGHLGELRSLQLFGAAMGDEGLIALTEAAERFPHLERLELTRSGLTAAGVTALARSPLMAHLKSLWLRDNVVGPDGLRALARADAPALEELWLSDTQLSDVGTSLAKARWPALWRLDLDNSGLSPASLSALLRAEWLPRLRGLSMRGLSFSRRRIQKATTGTRAVELRSLSLGSPTLTDAGLARFLEPFQYPELRSFWVSDSQIGDEAIRALTAHPCTHLNALYLMSNQIGTAGAWRLLTTPNLPALRDITLSRNRIGLEEVPAPVPPTAPHLHNLDLSHNPMTPGVARAMLARPELALLKKLKLSFCHLGPSGGEMLAAGHLGEPLKELFLCRTNLQDEGVIALLQARFLPALRDLSLQGVEVGEEGLAALVEADNLDGLLSLRLDRNPLGPDAGDLLTSAPWMPRLTYLNLSDTSIGDEGVAALVSSPAVGRLYFLGLNAVGLTAEGVTALLNSKHLASRASVHVAGNAEDLQDRFGPALARRFREVDFKRHPHVDYAW